MWTIDISEIMKMWADSNPEKSRLITTLMSSYDHQRGVYRVLMESKDLRGNKIRTVKLVNDWTLIKTKDLQSYMFVLFNDMFDELYKEKEKNMGVNTCGVRVDNDQMLKMAKAAVVCWYNQHNAPSVITMDDVYIVWFCKTLQNWKALAGTHHGDGMYYEITFNGDKDCAYVDAYKKWDNTTMTSDLLPGRSLHRRSFIFGTIVTYLDAINERRINNDFNNYYITDSYYWNRDAHKV